MSYRVEKEERGVSRGGKKEEELFQRASIDKEGGALKSSKREEWIRSLKTMHVP